MISVRAGLLGREDQPLAHFKADGLKINFNWDPYATSDQVKESKNFLRQCILKVVIKNGEPLYSLLKERPNDQKDPLSIRDALAAKPRTNRKEAPKVDVAWDRSDNHKFEYLYGKLMLSRMNARSSGSGRDLKFVEGGEPGEWICKGKTGRTIMTTAIRQSDSKLRFTFSPDSWQLESRLAASIDHDPTARKPNSRPL